jgi:Putative adhesin
MSERCTNCGLELFARQQFCRRCGAAVRPQQAGDERPTQILEGRAEGAQGFGAGPRGVDESRGGGAGTDPFGEARPTAAAQSPFRAFAQTAPLAPAVRRGGAKWWTFPFIFMVALACLGVILLRRQAQPPTVVVKRGGLAETGHIVPPLPPLPAEMPAVARAAIESAGVPTPFDESGATVTGDRTVITKTVQLDEDVAFSIPQAVGDVTIEGWDGDEAEIKVVKRGGSAEERRLVPVMLARGEGRVSLLSPPASVAGKSGVRVSYEIKLPRELKQLEITGEESKVELKNFDGSVLVDVKAGTIALTDVTGVVRSKLIKGSTKVSFQNGTHDGAQEFSVVRGNVEVDFDESASTDVKAETMDGRIEADEALGLRLVTNAAGRHALGRLGEGRDPMLIKVVNGDIKLKK